MAQPKSERRSDLQAPRPRAIRAFTWTLLLLAAVLTPHRISGASSALESKPAGQSPTKLTDMTVLNQDGKELLLVLDGELRSVFSYELTDASPARIGLGAFTPFLSSPRFLNPTAIAYHRRKLYVCDRGAQAVFEVNLESGEMKKILDSSHLSAPVSIAVAANGTIAVGDNDLNDIVMVEPSGEPKRLGHQLNDPARMSFVGSDLVVLKSGEGVVWLATRDSPRSMVQEIEAVNLLLRSVKNGGVPADLNSREERNWIKDFAIYNGVYYVADKGRVLVFTPNSSYKSFPVFEKREDNAVPSQITVSPRYVLVGEESTGGIRKLSRPVPASVSFGVDASKAQNEVLEQQHFALASLYEYLDARGLLQRRTIRARRDYATPLELLRDEGALTNWPARNLSEQKADDAEKRLAELLAKLNGWADNCKGCPAERSIQKGTPVQIPDVPMEKIVTASDVPLGSKTVQEHLLERVAPEHLAQLSANYLLNLNKNRLQSLEAEISREDFIPVSNPAMALRPGTIVRFEKGKEVSLGHLSQCSVGMSDKIKEMKMLPSVNVSSAAIESALPRSEATASKALSAKLKSLREILISFENVNEEFIHRSDLNAALNAAAGNQQCAQLLSAPNVYVVMSARRASSAKYKLLSKGHESKFIKKDELAQLSLRGEVDESREWSFIVSEPVYLGYTLVRVNMQTEARTWESISQARAIRPWSSFNIFSEKNRVLKLPATVWRLSLFVHARDLIVTPPELSKISDAPGVDLLSEEKYSDPTTGYAVNLTATAQDSHQPADLQAELERIRENHRKLLEKIKYVPPLPQISSIIIGIGEAERSIHKDHPAFMDERGSVWFEKSGISLVTRPRPHGNDTQPPIRLIKRFSKEDDHGDHVAGLIAARSDPAPGLIPGVGLYLIDNSSAAALGKSIDEALALVPNVEIFNFSFDIPGYAADKSQEELLTNMSEKWYSPIFIVSAGNDGKNIGKMSERVPISWADRVPNIIGVAATHDEDDLIADMLPGLSSVLAQKGSNFGEKYVHLAAPGKELFSVASENCYAQATGTSQAAPLVTAAVAMLYAQGIIAPPTIKARLIYTADWVTQLEKKVWGGLLNYRRAVWQPHENLLTLKSATSEVKAFKFRDSAITVGDKSVAFDARGEEIARPSTIRFSDILRIERVAGGALRVVYLERHSPLRKIRILRNASLSGEVVCEKLQDWDEARGQFNEAAQCQRNYDASEIFDYVAATPTFAISF